jgi:hypothetical protein
MRSQRCVAPASGCSKVQWGARQNCGILPESERPAMMLEPWRGWCTGTLDGRAPASRAVPRYQDNAQRVEQ